MGVNMVYKWKDVEDKAEVERLIGKPKSDGESEFITPSWFDAWMDDNVYPIRSECKHCGTRLTDWKNDVCKCDNSTEPDPKWICSLCKVELGNDIRDDYVHLMLEHPDSVIMGRLAYSNKGQ